jgi:hypothetical protein
MTEFETQIMKYVDAIMSGISIGVILSVMATVPYMLYEWNRHRKWKSIYDTKQNARKH